MRHTIAATEPAGLPAARPVIQAEVNGKTFDGAPGSYCWPSTQAAPACDFVDDPQPTAAISVAEGDTITFQVVAARAAGGGAATAAAPAVPPPTDMVAVLLDDQNADGVPRQSNLTQTQGAFKAENLKPGPHRIAVDALYTAEGTEDQPFVRYVFLLQVGQQVAVAPTTAAGTAAPTKAVTAVRTVQPTIATKAVIAAATTQPPAATTAAPPVATKEATKAAARAATTAVAAVTTATTVATTPPAVIAVITATQQQAAVTRAATTAPTAVPTTGATALPIVPTNVPTTALITVPPSGVAPTQTAVPPTATAIKPSPTTEVLPSLTPSPTAIPSLTGTPFPLPTVEPMTPTPVVPTGVGPAGTPETVIVVVTGTPMTLIVTATPAAGGAVLPEQSVIVGGRRFEPIAVSVCVLGQGGEQICVNRPQNANAERINAAAGDVAQLNFNGPRPTSLIVSLLSAEGNTVINKQTLSPDNLVLYGLPTKPGSYVLSVEVNWPQGKAIYYYRLVIGS